MSETDTPLTFVVRLPPRALSPNYEGRFNRPLRTTYTRTYKEEVRLVACSAAVGAKWVMPARVRVSLVFMTGRSRVYPDDLYRPLDVPNAVAAFKAGFDGLVAAGLFRDDRHSVMELGGVQIRPQMGPPGVSVTVDVID